ncbi:recombinase RecT [Candidatus Pacearchaeota archaeon]|nr:recombinase RecT [Candidatus Pacearchaeota archaeon]
MQNILMATVMPENGRKVTNEQFVSFVAVANNYDLDPLKKEIYAFPAKGGGIQPVVSIDGWLRIINTHPEFDGMQLQETFDDKGTIFSITCTIHKKGIQHPVIITEYLSECIRNTDPWKKKIRMLRHKAAIQCGRYAFGLSGIVELDEAEAAIEKDITPTVTKRKPEPQLEVQPVAQAFDEGAFDIPEATPLDAVLQSFNQAQTIEHLDLIVEDAQQLSADDKSLCRVAYAEASKRIKSQA